MLRTPILPFGTRMVCGRCRKPFAMPAVTKPGAAKTRIVTNPKKTQLAPSGKPIYRIVCRACSTVMTGRGTVPVGRKLKCLKCQKELVIRPKAAPKPAGPAAKKAAPPKKAAPAKPARSGTPAVRAVKKSTPVAKTAKRARPAPMVPAPRPKWPFAVSVLLTALLLLAAAGYYYRIGPLAPAAIPSEQWKSFTTPDDVCRVEAPGTFLENVARAHGGGVIRASRFTANFPDPDQVAGDPFARTRVSDDATFLLTYSERNPEDVQRIGFDAIYQQERDYVVEYVKGELTTEKDVTASGLTGKEFQVDIGKRGVLIARVFHVTEAEKDRVFIVVAAGNHFRFVPEDAAKFLDSFRLK